MQKGWAGHQGERATGGEQDGPRQGGGAQDSLSTQGRWEMGEEAPACQSSRKRDEGTHTHTHTEYERETETERI